MNSDLWYMNIAFEEAEKAYRLGEVPVGAVIVNEDGRVISKASNLKESNTDPTLHAEVLAIQRASKEIGNWRLTGCQIFVTLEPCPMCAAAIGQARLKKLYFGAYDFKGGAFSLGYSFNKDRRLNHNYQIQGGLEHYKCSNLLSSFFKERRRAYKA